jgi:hypothetical protein
MTKRAALYCRISTGDQHLQTRLLDLREMATQRGLEIVCEYSDVVWGLYRPHIRSLDEHSAIWRKLYFWRNLVRTLMEIRKTLESLNTVPEFKRVLKKQPPRWQKKFSTIVGKLAKAEALVDEIRNSLGGHVLQKSVEKALRKQVELHRGRRSIEKNTLPIRWRTRRGNLGGWRVREGKGG